MAGRRDGQSARRVLGALLVVLGLAWASSALPAATSAAPAESAAVGQRIAGIEIRGNERVPANRILGQMRLREGSTYTQAAQDDDLKRIYGLGEFDDVRFAPQAGAAGLVLVVTVIERPALERLEFEGNRRFSDKDLSEAIDLKAGSVVDRGKLFAGARTLERKYRDAGYHFVHVALDVEQLAKARVARYTITEGPAVRISKIEFVGNSSIGSSELSKQMESNAYVLILHAGTFDETQLGRDLTALRSYYSDQGFLDVRVDRELEFSPDKTRLVVRVIVDEGPRYRVRSVVLEGVTRFSPPLLEKQMELSPGAPYTADRVKHDTQLIRDTYGEVGYIDAEIRAVPEFTSEPGMLDVAFKVVEGRAVRIREIRIEGNRVTQDRVIRRELGFYPEEPVNTKLIERAERRIEGTGLYAPNSVQITELPTTEPDTVDLLIRVEETQTGRTGFSAGVSSDNGLLGSLSFVERNFDITAWPKSLEDFRRGTAFRGAGQLFQIVLEPGTEMQEYRVDFRDPHIGDSDYSLSTSLFYFKRGRDTYDESRAGVMVGVGKELRPGLTGYLNLKMAAINISNIDATAPDDVTKVAGASTLTSVEAGVVKDTTDSLLLPTEGYRLRASVEQAVGGSYTFTKVIFDARRYFTVTRDVLDRRSVLSLRGQVGGILSDAPIFERFYAGGLGTIRGFRYRGVGPRQGDTELGGDFMALASAEYSFPIYEKNLQGVFFLDTGTVERDITITNWRASVGFGVRFTVPFFGPVPFDLNFGFPLMKGPNDRTEFFSFSIGTSF
jgi:outer membrane protein insertion porin family